MHLDWAKLESWLSLLLGGGLAGTLLTKLVDAWLNRRKVAKEADRLATENALLALNTSLAYLTQRVKELDAENIAQRDRHRLEMDELRARNAELKENQERLEQCIQALERSYDECAFLLKDKIAELERVQKTTIKDLQLKQAEGEAMRDLTAASRSRPA